MTGKQPFQKRPQRQLYADFLPLTRLDAAKSTRIYEQDAAACDDSLFRFKMANRDAW